MSEGIVVALIGAAGVVFAAVIGKNVFGRKNKTVIKQKIKGNGNTQIGIQNNQSSYKESKE